MLFAREFYYWLVLLNGLTTSLILGYVVGKVISNLLDDIRCSNTYQKRKIRHLENNELRAEYYNLCGEEYKLCDNIDDSIFERLFDE